MSESEQQHVMRATMSFIRILRQRGEQSCCVLHWTSECVLQQSACACVLQDLSMHKEEIHSKLVAIMRERLATNLKQLPSIANTWAPNSPPNAQQVPPSNFAQANAKQLRILSQVCCLLLHLHPPTSVAALKLHVAHELHTCRLQLFCSV